MKFSTLLLLSLPLTTAVVRPVEQEATLLHAVATASHNIMVDLCDYPELCACIKELAVHHDLSEVSAALCELHEMVAAGQTQVSVGLLKAVIDELMLLENRVANDLATLSLQLAATGIGSNYASSTAPFTTEIAGQNATDAAATQTVNIGVASAGAGAGLSMNIGTGYAAQTPQTITIGSPNTTTTFNGNVVWTNAGLSTSSLTSAGAATITTRSGNSGGTNRVFTFDSSTALGGNPTLYQPAGQTLVIGEKATAGSNLTLYSGTSGIITINPSNGAARTSIGAGTTTGQITIGGTAGQDIFIGRNASTTAAATNTYIGEQNSSTVGGDQAIFIGKATGGSTRRVQVEIAANVTSTTEQYNTFIGTQNSTAGGTQNISIGANATTASASTSTSIGLQGSTAGGTQSVNIGTGTGTAQTAVIIGNSTAANNFVSLRGGSSGGVAINSTGAGITAIGNGTNSAVLKGNVDINASNGAATTFIGTGTTTGQITIGGIAGQFIKIGQNGSTTAATTNTYIGEQNSATVGGDQFIYIGKAVGGSTRGVQVEIAGNVNSTTQQYRTFIGTQNSTAGGLQVIEIGSNAATASAATTTAIGVQKSNAGGTQNINIGTNATTASASTFTIIGQQSSNAGGTQNINIGSNQPTASAATTTTIGVQSSTAGGTQTVNIGTGPGTAQTSVDIGNTNNINNSVTLRGGSSGGVKYSFGPAVTPATLYPVGSTTAQPIEVAFAQITSGFGTWNGGTYSTRFGTSVTYSGVNAVSFTLTAPANYQIWGVTFNAASVTGVVTTALPGTTAGAVTVTTGSIIAVAGTVNASVLVYLVKVT